MYQLDSNLISQIGGGTWNDGYDFSYIFKYAAIGGMIGALPGLLIAAEGRTGGIATFFRIVGLFSAVTGGYATLMSGANLLDRFFFTQTAQPVGTID